MRFAGVRYLIVKREEQVHGDAFFWQLTEGIACVRKIEHQKFYFVLIKHLLVKHDKGNLTPGFLPWS